MAYPLPICELLGIPYWQINFSLCGLSEGWRTWQSRRPMSEIIQRIDESLTLVRETKTDG